MKFVCLTFLSLLSLSAFNQKAVPKFGQGITYTNADSTFYIKFGYRFQALYANDWTIRDDDFNYVGDHGSDFVPKRSRIKFEGYALSPKLKYKVELGLTNGDISGGDNAEHGNAPRFILDSYVDWNFYGNFSLRVGQSKLPGNRERVISSANMQFVDRSRLNSRFNIDRDMGLQLMHNFKIGKNFIVNETFAFSQGEGRDVTAGNLGGYDYTFRLEFLPFGKFTDKGDYVGGAMAREDKPKFAIGATYDINDRAVRENGQLGDFIFDSNGDYTGKTLNTIFVDFMFKYKGLSIMGEYVDKSTNDGDPYVYDIDGTTPVGNHFTGTGLNLQAGWMFKNFCEISARYTMVTPDAGISANETEYTLGFSKYFVGHSLKVQTDLGYRVLDFDSNLTPNQGKNDVLYWRVQFDIHF